VLPRSFPVALAPQTHGLHPKGDAKTRGRTAEGGGQEQLLSNWMILLFDKNGVSKLLVIPSPTLGLLLGYNINWVVVSNISIFTPTWGNFPF